MSQPEDVDRRLTAVEQELADLRRQTAEASVDASAARTLAAGADRDVSEVRAELRAHLSVLNALRETQLERFAQVDARFDRVDERFDRVDERFAQVDARFDRVDARFGEVADAFVQVDANFASVDRQFATVHAGLAHIVALIEDRDA